MDLENRTVKITQTGFKCPIDDNRLEYTQIRFNVNNGQWNYYFCQHCKAVYDKTDEEYLMKKAREHLSLLQEMPFKLAAGNAGKEYKCYIKHG
ncbi:hypothetical protein J4406_00920 [Candidatus Woesearchaeota archaeon]|nr:hypothetical protein [Candidatus Woesearchaeota archaeon]